MGHGALDCLSPRGEGGGGGVDSKANPLERLSGLGYLGPVGAAPHDDGAVVRLGGQIGAHRVPSHPLDVGRVPLQDCDLPPPEQCSAGQECMAPHSERIIGMQPGGI
jgi:hypothetical protein